MYFLILPRIMHLEIHKLLIHPLLAFTFSCEERPNANQLSASTQLEHSSRLCDAITSLLLAPCSWAPQSLLGPALPEAAWS